MQKIKRYKFNLISDDRWGDNIHSKLEELKRKIKEKGGIRESKFSFCNEKVVFFPDECRQKRVSVIGETEGTWNQVYEIVNSVQSSKIKKLL